MSLPIAGELVWVAGSRGPVAEKWSAATTAGAKADKVVLARHPLGPDAFHMAIAILEQRYPAPTAPADPTLKPDGEK